MDNKILKLNRSCLTLSLSVNNKDKLFQFRFDETGRLFLYSPHSTKLSEKKFLQNMSKKGHYMLVFYNYSGIGDYISSEVCKLLVINDKSKHRLSLKKIVADGYRLESIVALKHFNEITDLDVIDWVKYKMEGNNYD